jgi:hypothetical protein
METDEELTQLKNIKKQCLQKLIALGTQYINSWTECLEVSDEVQLIRQRQRQRTNEGFSVNNHPQNSPGFHSLPQDLQFAARQQFEKQTFDNQKDEQTKNTLNQQFQEARQRGLNRLKMIEELYSVIANFSRIVSDISYPEDPAIAEEEIS